MRRITMIALLAALAILATASVANAGTYYGGSSYGSSYGYPSTGSSSTYVPGSFSGGTYRPGYSLNTTYGPRTVRVNLSGRHAVVGLRLLSSQLFVQAPVVGTHSASLPQPRSTPAAPATLEEPTPALEKSQ